MLKKRVIGVVTVKAGWAVQSFGYHRYLPLGRPEYLVGNLDRWGADEIVVQVIDRSKNQLGPDFDLIEKKFIINFICYEERFEFVQGSSHKLPVKKSAY